MEHLITRYRNVSILVAVLFAQVLGLAVQVKRNTENEPSRLIRIWTVSAVAPFEKGIVWIQTSAAHLWHNYFYLRGVRQENRELKAEIERLRLERVRLSEDAEQARRLQALLGFKEQFVSRTMAAQVIGSSGSEQSRSVYIDKGSGDGIEKDMAVITADGIVGKVLRVFPSTSLVLLIDDQTSGVGAILEKSRLQGIVRGTPSGEVAMEKVMADEQVQAGEKVLTSGGDRIFPKGLAVGTVTKVSPGPELFLNIRAKPSANLSKLEEVLVITRMEETAPTTSAAGPVRAVDVLAQRLPSVPDKPPTDASKPPAATGTPSPPAGAAQATKPNAPRAVAPKPGVTGTTEPDRAAENPIATPGGQITPAPAPKPAPSSNPPAGKQAATGSAAAEANIGTPAAAKPVAPVQRTGVPPAKKPDKTAGPAPPQPQPQQTPPEDHPQ